MPVAPEQHMLLLIGCRVPAATIGLDLDHTIPRILLPSTSPAVFLDQDPLHLPQLPQHRWQNVSFDPNRERCLWRGPGPRRQVLGSPD